MYNVEVSAGVGVTDLRSGVIRELKVPLTRQLEDDIRFGLNKKLLCLTTLKQNYREGCENLPPAQL